MRLASPERQANLPTGPNSSERRKHDGRGARAVGKFTLVEQLLGIPALAQAIARFGRSEGKLVIVLRFMFTFSF